MTNVLDRIYRFVTNK